MYWVQLAMLAVSAVSAAGSAKAGKAAQAASNEAAYKSELQGARSEARSGIEAQYVVDRAREEANRIKQQATIKRGAQIAAAANSGVVVGNGSTQQMVDETMRLATQDAISAMMDGARGFTTGMTKASDAREAATAQAASYAAQGKSLLSQGISTALGTVSSGLSTYAANYK